ncbi:MAG: hypothetical protein MUE50_10105 [Pirellulaceae bacterium]|nr:hypothetical protein [Pirellulaceae bacterium]
MNRRTDCSDRCAAHARRGGSARRACGLLLVVLSWSATLAFSAAADAPPRASSESTAEAPGTGTVLPWNRPSEGDVQPPTPRLSSAREMLEMFSIDASQIRQLEDGRPLVVDEDETLFKILYRLPSFGMDKIEAWCKRGADWAELAEQPATRRLGVFLIEGRATGVQRLDLPAEMATRLEYSCYFRVRLQLAGVPYPVLVCCRAVPRAWESASQLDEPASCYGLFLKTGGDESGHPELIFAAERVAWLPQRPEPSRGVTPSIVYLASLGMDAGLFDSVRNTNRKAITGEDRECFYQLLAAIGRAAPADVFGRAEAAPDLTLMLTQPETQHGRLVSLSGTAKRVQKIAIDEPDIQQRFGIDHYYQVDVFVSLNDTEIRLEPKGGKKEAPVFRNNYPVTCCVLALPAALPARDDISVPVRFAGVYFKLWAYKSEYVSAFDDRQRQVSPLFIATTPRVMKFDDSGSQLLGWIGGIAFVVLILFAGFYTWFPWRGDKRVEERLLRPRLELGSASSLNDLDLPVQDKPDFSGLAARDRGPSREPEKGEG